MLLENSDNLIERFFEESFVNFGVELDIFDVFLVLFWSIILSITIAMTYRGTHRGVSYSQSFTQTLVILGMVVSIVMLIVGTNIARAFTLVGALSIVRFRNATKDSRDLGFIFFIMAVGMACGTKFFPIAIIVTFVGCGLIYFLTLTRFGEKGLAQDVLELSFPKSKEYAKVLSPIFIRYLKYYSLLSIDSIDDRTNRLSFIITLKKKKKKKKTAILKKSKKREDLIDKLGPKSKLLSEIQKIEYITDIKLIEGSSAEEL